MRRLRAREHRPTRDELPERPLSNPSTLITDRTVNVLWVGDTVRQLIQDESLNGVTYTYSQTSVEELEPLLDSVDGDLFFCDDDSLKLFCVYLLDEDRVYQYRFECPLHDSDEGVSPLD